MTKPFIVGFGGTTRAASTSERLVGAVLAEAEHLGAQTRLFGGLALAALPHYAPEKPGRSPEQLAFLDAVRHADALVIATPAYHGGMSGLVKNAIDLIADLQNDERIFLDGRAVGLIAAAGGWQGAGVTLSAMRDMVHALRGWPTPVGIATGGTVYDSDGVLVDKATRNAVADQARQLVEFSESWTVRLKMAM